MCDDPAALNHADMARFLADLTDKELADLLYNVFHDSRLDIDRISRALIRTAARRLSA